MSWMGWVVIVIIGFNALFFGMLGMISLYDKWKEAQKDERHGIR